MRSCQCSFLRYFWSSLSNIVPSSTQTNFFMMSFSNTFYRGCSCSVGQHLLVIARMCLLCLQSKDVTIGTTSKFMHKHPRHFMQQMSCIRSQNCTLRAAFINRLMTHSVSAYFHFSAHAILLECQFDAFHDTADPDVDSSQTLFRPHRRL